MGRIKMLEEEDLRTGDPQSFVIPPTSELFQVRGTTHVFDRGVFDVLRSTKGSVLSAEFEPCKENRLTVLILCQPTPPTQPRTIQRASVESDNNPTCVMCLEDFKPNSMFVSHCSCTGQAGHICLKCAGDLVRQTIEQTSKPWVVCPLCNGDWSVLDISQLCTVEQFAKLTDRRLAQEISRVPEIVKCLNPDCLTALIPSTHILAAAPSFVFPLNSADKPSSTQVISRITCPRCSQDYCAACRVTWHDGFSCGGWPTRDHQRDERETERWKRNNTKPCPQCHSPIFAEATSRVTCYSCQCEFCFKCGGRWHPAHPRYTNVRGCIGRNWVNMWNTRAYGVEVMVKHVARVVGLVVAGVIGVGLAVVASPFVLLGVGCIKLRGWWRRRRG
eukprot:c15052_g1_i2.p1 GENE.c15052_g1_i2~~c15052_g1_i2.p1  ORF type:complete len:388 (+),score=47.06 c15052_g1_i2:1-1164(+)